jgi:hypothetical protein
MIIVRANSVVHEMKNKFSLYERLTKLLTIDQLL